MAALISRDESVITNLHFLDRGYENLVNKLTNLGANVKRTVQRDAQPNNDILLSEHSPENRKAQEVLT